MPVLSVTLTAAGRRLASSLPWPACHGSLAETVRREWDAVDGFVLFASAGLAVRVIAPLLGPKQTDPAVVCVDDAGRWAISLVGGHAGGANALARQVAGLLGGEAVVTTASDASGLPPLDALPGWAWSGDAAGVMRSLIDGEPVGLDRRVDWPLPPALEERLVDGAAPGVVVSDRSEAERPGVVVLRPPSLIVGIGASSGAPSADLAALAAAALDDADLDRRSVAAIATLDRKESEPAIVALAEAWRVPVVGLAPAALADVEVPNPSAVVEAAVATPSVAEAAALLLAGDGAQLLVPKRRSSTATVAVARRRPSGHLAVVGLGPGGPSHRTPAASAAILAADVVIGFEAYVDMASDVIPAGALVLRSPIGDEVARASAALGHASAGRRVALVCSGDAGVYALATLVFERSARYPSVDPRAIEVVPGVTAALASAAVLGAPLAHDHVAISLSDLLTPWEVIERRLVAAAEADLVVSLYNPRSRGRTWQLGKACAVLAGHRPSTTPVGVVTDAGRPGERVRITTLADFDTEDVGMTTCVVVGSTTTRVIGGRMVTPRGYSR